MKLPVAGEIRTIWKKWGRHIFEQSFAFPNGKKDDYFVFDTVNQFKPVIVFPLTQERGVVAIRQFRTGANAVVLELPGGQPKPGQTPEDVLRGELVEETGYRPGEIVPFNQNIWFDPASCRVSYVPFLALGCTFVKEPDPDPDELIEVVKIPYDEWIERIRNGEVKDNKSIAVTLLVELFLRDFLRWAGTAGT